MGIFFFHHFRVSYSGLGQPPDTKAIRPFSDHVIQSFGSSRLTRASDWPRLQLASDYDFWCAQTKALLVDLSPPDRDAIRGRTARRVYGLDADETGSYADPL